MIFIDRSIPKSVANALKLVRSDVAWLEDFYAHDTKDEIWLRDAGANDWLVVCRDKKVRTRPGQRRAILDNGVGCFVLAMSKNLTRWEYLKLLTLTLDDMVSLFNATPRPFVFTIDSTGRFSRRL